MKTTKFERIEKLFFNSLFSLVLIILLSGNIKAQCAYNSVVDIDLSDMFGTGRNTASDLYAYQTAPSFGSGNVLNLFNPTPFW